MQSNLAIERTYQVVQFEPLKVSQSISGIPENLDQDVLKLLTYYLMLRVEMTASAYMLLTKKLETLDPEEELSYLEAELNKVVAKLQTTYHITLGE